MRIGLSGYDFRLSAEMLGEYPGTVAIENTGKFHQMGKEWAEHQANSGFGSGDVVGCGLLVIMGERHIFFTKNDEILGKSLP